MSQRGWVMVIACCLAGPAMTGQIERVGKMYWTTANIWYEKPDEIHSTNYHVGQILPAGTEVKIVHFGGDKIRFSVGEKGEFTMLLMRKHSRLDLAGCFDQYFSDEDPLAPEAKFHRFTREEQRHIADGTLGAGMCREAVLMAYGYPPSHKTPKLDADTWVYWQNKWRSQEVAFDKQGKVVSF
jgi:hypothetical protein